MGNELSSHKEPPPPLPPLAKPTGLIKGLCYPYEVTLKLEEQVGWSGDTFDITDINGRPCFKLQGKAMSFSQRKTLKDMNGVPVVTMKNEFAFRLKFGIYPGEGEDEAPQLAKIKPHTFFGVTVDIEFTNVDGAQRTMSLEGNFRASEAVVTLDDGSIVGRISKHRWNANQFLFDNQTYYITCAPNADLSLMMCICVALDEAKHDQQK